MSYDPTRPEIVGLNWVRQGAQWDIAHKHGDLASCIQKGQEAGHIQAPSKRSWAQCEAASSSTMRMPDDWKLLAIERIFDCRCATPAALPARAPTLHSRVRMPHPGADLDGKDAVDVENGRIMEEEMRTNVEYLLLGHFKRKEGDAKGMHIMLWLALADFDNSAVSNEEVDAKLDAWEVQGARIRNEARRLQREGAAET